MISVFSVVPLSSQRLRRILARAAEVDFHAHLEPGPQAILAVGHDGRNLARLILGADQEVDVLDLAREGLLISSSAPEMSAQIFTAWPDRTRQASVTSR